MAFGFGVAVSWVFVLRHLWRQSSYCSDSYQSFYCLFYAWALTGLFVHAALSVFRLTPSVVAPLCCLVSLFIHEQQKNIWTGTSCRLLDSSTLWFVVETDVFVLPETTILLKHHKWDETSRLPKFPAWALGQFIFYFFWSSCFCDSLKLCERD